MEAKSGKAGKLTGIGFIIHPSNAVSWIITIQDIGHWKKNLKGAIKEARKAIIREKIQG